MSSLTGPCANQLAVVDDHDLVDELLHLPSTWLEMKTVFPSAGERPQEVAESSGSPSGSEPVGGLVEDQQIRLAEQRAGNTQPLAHTEQ